LLFRQPFWAGLADGSVTVAFRRWKRPNVKAGGTLQSPGGLLGIDEVSVVAPDELTDGDVAAAGYRSRAEALADLRPDGDLYRIRFHRVGDDPRITLRAREDLSPDEVENLRRRLNSTTWAMPTLLLIAARPATVSTELAAELGEERLRFKQRVRRLKALGLTESLDVGYRLSPGERRCWRASTRLTERR
jgi:hypothetical protein